MKNYSTEDLELANELLADQNSTDQFGNRLFSWANIQWAILVQMYFERMKMAAIKLQRRFRFSYNICLRWAMRAFNEGTFKQVIYG